MEKTFAVEKRTFPSMTVLSVRTVDTLMAMGKYIKGLYGQAARRGLRPAGPVFTLYYEKPGEKPELEYELCLPVTGPAEELEQLADMGGDTCLYLRVKGSYAQFGKAYAALVEFADTSGWTISGPPREIYVRGPLPWLPHLHPHHDHRHLLPRGAQKGLGLPRRG